MLAIKDPLRADSVRGHDSALPVRCQKYPGPWAHLGSLCPLWKWVILQVLLQYLGRKSDKPKLKNSIPGTYMNIRSRESGPLREGTVFFVFQVGDVTISITVPSCGLSHRDLELASCRLVTPPNCLAIADRPHFKLE